MCYRPQVTRSRWTASTQCLCWRRASGSSPTQSRDTRALVGQPQSASSVTRRPEPRGKDPAPDSVITSTRSHPTSDDRRAPTRPPQPSTRERAIDDLTSQLRCRPTAHRGPEPCGRARTARAPRSPGARAQPTILARPRGASRPGSRGQRCRCSSAACCGAMRQLCRTAGVTGPPVVCPNPEPTAHPSPDAWPRTRVPPQATSAWGAARPATRAPEDHRQRRACVRPPV
jgi:hypothetical protein